MVLIGLAAWALTNKEKPVSAAVQPSLPPVSPNVPVGPTTIQVAGGSPVVVPVATPQNVTAAIVSAIAASPSVDTIRVVSPETGTDYSIDVSSVTQAAAIQGKDPQAWLLEYAYGIAPAPAPTWADPIDTWTPAMRYQVFGEGILPEGWKFVYSGGYAVAITPITSPVPTVITPPTAPQPTNTFPAVPAVPGPVTIQAGSAPAIVVAPTPQVVAAAIAAAIEADPGADIQVVSQSAGLDYHIDTSSVVQAAAISGQTVENWLLEFAYGIAPAPEPAPAPVQPAAVPSGYEYTWSPPPGYATPSNYVPGQGYLVPV